MLFRSTGSVEKLVDDDDVPAIPHYFNECVVYKALELMERAINRDEQQAGTWERLYKTELKSSKNEYRLSQIVGLDSIQEVC